MVVPLWSLVCRLSHCLILGTAPAVGAEFEGGPVRGGWTEQVSAVTEGAIWCPGLTPSGPAGVQWRRNESQVHFCFLLQWCWICSTESKGRCLTLGLTVTKGKNYAAVIIAAVYSNVPEKNVSRGVPLCLVSTST